MVINKLDSIEFRLNELHDFTWLKKYGTAFWVVDATGSGCICIGLEDAERKYFCKIAGVNTVYAEVSPEESVKILKEAVQLYHDLSHPNLIKIIEEYDYKQFYVAVFENEESNRIAVKAVSPDKCDRYLTFTEFYHEWKKARGYSSEGEKCDH